MLMLFLVIFLAVLCAIYTARWLDGNQQHARAIGREIATTLKWAAVMLIVGFFVMIGWAVMHPGAIQFVADQ